MTLSVFSSYNEFLLYSHSSMIIGSCYFVVGSPKDVLVYHCIMIELRI